MNYALLLINLVCSIIPLLARNKLKGLKWSLSILFIFLAIRYDFGEDYIAYYDLFQKYSFVERANSKIEIGFNLICELFRPVGFYSMVAFLAGIYCYSLYNVIKRYISPQWYWLCIFCLISNPDVIFVGCSAMRQTAALSMILLSLPFLEKKKPLLFFVFVALATCFHRSAIFFVILYPLLKVKINKFYILLIGLSSVLIMTVLQSSFNVFINNTVSTYFDKYEAYDELTNDLTSSLFGTLIRLFFISVFLYKMLKETDRMRLILYIFGIAYGVIFVVGSQSMLLRFTLYFGYFVSFCFTYVVEEHRTRGKIYSVLSYILILFWHFNLALTFANHNHWYEYHTILSLL